MDLHFLGTGAGMPSKMRNTSSLALNLTAEGEGYWLFDCGEATQHQILHTTIKPRKVQQVFITHLHGDHIFGLPGFVSSRSFQGGDEPLHLYGPPGLEEWLELTLRISRTHLTYPIVYHEVEEGLIFENDRFRVLAKPLKHVISTFGYRIEQKPLLGKLQIDKALALGVPKGSLLKQLKEGNDVVLPDGQVVYSKDVTDEPQQGWTLAILGDTRPCQAAVELAENADILIHEATFEAGTQELARQYGHSTIEDAAEIAKKAKVGHLIVNHISSRFLLADCIQLKLQGEAIFQPISIAADFSRYSFIHGKVTEEVLSPFQK